MIAYFVLNSNVQFHAPVTKCDSSLRERHANVLQENQGCCLSVVAGSGEEGNESPLLRGEDGMRGLGADYDD